MAALSRSADPAAGWLGSFYENANPCFFICESTVEQLPELNSAGHRDLRPVVKLVSSVHWALVMTLGPLLDPGYSMAYALMEPSGIIMRMAGPLERDLLMTFASQPRLLTPADALLVRHRAQRVRFLMDLGEEDAVLRAFDGARLLGAPDASVADALVQTVQTLEDIINPDGQMGRLAEDFADHLALLVCPTFEGLGQWRDVCKQFYKVRSVIVHGGAVREEIAKLEAMTPGLQLVQLIYYICICVSSALGALVERHRTYDSAEVVWRKLFGTSEPMTKDRFSSAQQSINRSWLSGEEASGDKHA
jgi:hypothetical protein